MVGGEEVATTLEISTNIMKEQMIQALVKHAEAEVDLHKANIEVYMQQVVGIGEHSDIIETIQKELDKMATAHDRKVGILLCAFHWTYAHHRFVFDLLSILNKSTST